MASELSWVKSKQNFPVIRRLINVLLSHTTKEAKNR